MGPRNLRFFCFRPGITFLSKFGPKIKIVSSNWNLVLRLIWICRIQLWCSFFLFFTANTLFGQIWHQNSKMPVKLKPGTKTDSNMQNSMAMFTFSALDRKYPIWANLTQKVKIVKFSWNLVPRLIRICRMKWQCSPFLF